MDAPLERGPLLRWQRKAIEAGMRARSTDGYFFFLSCASAILKAFLVGYWETIGQPRYIGI